MVLFYVHKTFENGWSRSVLLNFFDAKLYLTEGRAITNSPVLLFYHLKLRCYVVIELKVERFKPEHWGQLGFYISAIDRDIKTDADNPTVGLLICKPKNSIVAEYAFRCNIIADRYI